MFLDEIQEYLKIRARESARDSLGKYSEVIPRPPNRLITIFCFSLEFSNYAGVKHEHNLEQLHEQDRIVGAAHQVKGAAKQTVGKVAGDANTQAEGAAEKAAGKVQNAVGGAKDAVRPP